jgi:hypothetical protein
MPCTCDRLAGPRSPPEAARVRLKPVTAASMAGSRAMGPREPCQDREVAALSGQPHVLRGSPAGAYRPGVRRVRVRRRWGARRIFFVVVGGSLVRYTNRVSSPISTPIR